MLSECLQDPAMREFAEELLSYSDIFNRAVLFSLKGESLNEISKIQDMLCFLHITV